VHDNVSGARIQRIFQEFLDDRDGTLDDLSSGDLVNDMLWE
jgi:hypothetical protein